MEDALLKERILAAIEWETGVDVAATGVSVAEGIVRLFGNVGTSTERQVLERVGQGVCGVAALTNDLDVRAWRAHRSIRSQDSDMSKREIGDARRNSGVESSKSR